MDRSFAVSLSSRPRIGTEIDPVVDRIADSAPRTVATALDAALELGRAKPLPGRGDTRGLWETLAGIASVDLGAARAIEPHLDALAILEQAPPGELPAIAADPRCTWGVFAAEGGPQSVRAAQQDGVWRLTGVKIWCSLASTLDAALVTAVLPDHERRLFAVDLGQEQVIPEDAPWDARGLTEIPSGPVRFAGAAAYPVGAAGWYLQRPGFSWGGIGVAACWYGGAVGLARTLFAAARRPDPEDLLLMHLGAVDAQLQSARRALSEAAQLVDSGDADGIAGRLLAKRVRTTVARACEEILAHVAHALGPAPLAQDAEHAKRVADLQLYIRQHHAERDDVSLGEALVSTNESPW